MLPSSFSLALSSSTLSRDSNESPSTILNPFGDDVSQLTPSSPISLDNMVRKNTLTPEVRQQNNVAPADFEISST
eukprot:8695887-Ditylum_brightwellii.AAC.1